MSGTVMGEIGTAWEPVASFECYISGARYDVANELLVLNVAVPKDHWAAAQVLAGIGGTMLKVDAERQVMPGLTVQRGD